MEKHLVRERIWNYKQRHTVVVKEDKVMNPVRASVDAALFTF